MLKSDDETIIYGEHDSSDESVNLSSDEISSDSDESDSDSEVLAPPMINQLTRLREILSLQRRQVILLSIPYFTEQPHGGATETSAINGMMSEVFEGTDVMVELPESMEMRPFRPNDYAHYSYDSAEQIVRYIRPLLILN